jgi:hypothetical protein
MNDETYSYDITLEVGDWSNDGHNQSEKFTIACNAPMAAVKDAYNKGTALLGFDFVKECCVEYEESSIETEKVKKLAEFGIVEYWNGKDGVEDENRITHDENFHIDELMSDTWCRLYMKIVQLGEPWIRYEFVKGEWIDIGGYGLFWA